MRPYLILLLLFSYSILCAQFFESDKEKELFLIGTLGDYMGHPQTFTTHGGDLLYQMVDMYEQKEHPLASFILSSFKDEYPDLYMVDDKARKKIQLYSEPLTLQINNYYDYKLSGFIIEGKDTVYTGVLKKEMIVDLPESQQLSFLSGVYIKHGPFTPKGENRYSIQIPNSGGILSLLNEVLPLLGCEDVEYKIEKDFIPHIHTVFFTPSEKVLTVMQQAKALETEIYTP